MAILPLSQLVTNLRLEAGQSSNPATGVNIRDQLVYLLNRTQEELATNYDWPFLTVDRDVALTAGTRFYPYPADLPFDNIDDAVVLGSASFGRLEYGIGPAEYLSANSETGFLSWPVRRWMHHSDDNTFELWPVPSIAPAATPASLSARVRFRGIRDLPVMVNDADKCVLPATILTLFASAEVLARQKSPDAQLKLQKAQEYLRRYKVRENTHKSGSFVIGGEGDGYRRQSRVGFDYIPSGYGSGPGTDPLNGGFDSTFDGTFQGGTA